MNKDSYYSSSIKKNEAHLKSRVKHFIDSCLKELALQKKMTNDYKAARERANFLNEQKKLERLKKNKSKKQPRKKTLQEKIMAVCQKHG